jgi:IclR family acetate operon transcriptional repressor
MTRPAGQPAQAGGRGSRAAGGGADEVGVLGKALDILECLVREDGLTAAELASRSQISRPAAYRILNTLQRRGYVVAPSGVRRFVLGPAVYAFTASLARSGGLPAIARPVMQRLFGEFNETMNLGVLSADQVLYVDMLESDQRLRTTAGVGDVDCLHSTALGKAMLALLPDDEVLAVLERVERPARTPSTKVSIDDLLADIAEARRCGYAIDDEENVVGSRCVAAAIADADGRPMAALSISGPATRMPADLVARMGKRLADAAAELSGGMGF